MIVNQDKPLTALDYLIDAESRSEAKRERGEHLI